MKRRIQEAYQVLEQKFPPWLVATAKIRGFSAWNIPLLFSVSPTIVELNDAESVVRIPLNRWTKNHHGSMYFGALAIGADSAVGILAVHHMDKVGAKISLIFKDFQASFLKRAEKDVEFVCEQGKQIAGLIKKVSASSERHNLPIKCFARCKGSSEPVAEFTLTLSLKKK